MKLSSVGKWSMIAALTAALPAAPASTQEGQTIAAAVAAPATPTAGGSDSGKASAPEAKSSQAPAPKTSAAVKYSAGVGEVLKLVQAGVSKEVIQTYIEHGPVVCQLSAADIIALKEHSVPDELIAAMVKRGAQLTPQAGRLPSAPAAGQAEPLSSTPGPVYAGLDPESYDFWWYHYAYPRALAAANQRLLSAGPACFEFSLYPYGFYRPLPLYPHGGAAVVHPRFLRRPYY